MMFVRLNRGYFDEAGDDGGEGGGAGGGSEPTVAELQTQIAALGESQTTLQQENDRLNGKITEANKHKKEQERAARDAQRAKAEADGNYEQLFKSSEVERESLTQQLTGLQSSIESKEINGAAMRIASNLAEGANIELLSEFITRRLKFAEGSIKVVDETGSLTVSSLDDLANEFAGSSRYASLIKGRQSSGGSASGGSSSGGAVKIMKRADFDALDPISQSKFMKDGGKLEI
jgi:hypothetical protein